MGQVIALIEQFPEKPTAAEYKKYIKMGRDLYQNSEDKEIKKIFKQFVTECPECGAPIEDCRLKGARLTDFYAITKLRCPNGHEFKCMLPREGEE